MRQIKTTIHISLLMLAIGGMLRLLAACTSAPSEKPIVTVSIEPQKYLLEQITGDKVDIRTLISNGANPESYDPSLTHIMNLSKSIGFLRMGNIGFEAALLDKIREEDPELPIFNTSEGVATLTGTHSHGGVTKHDEVDPHTWTSVKNAKIIAGNMLDAMVKIDPKNADYYRRNHQKFALHLDSLDNAFAERLAPLAGGHFMVWHPSLSYFARDYGLEQIAAGSSENKEVSAGMLRETVDHAAEHKVGLFFYQKDLDSRQAEVISEQLGLKQVSINPLSYDWEEELKTIVDALTENATAEE